MTTRRAVHANWKQAGVSLALCLGAFAILWTVRSQGGLEFLELKTYDALLRSERRDYSFASRFLIVGMNDADFDRYGYPIPDGTLKSLIAKLQESEPRAIAVDIVRNLPVPSLEFQKKGTPMALGWNTELRDFLKEEKNWNICWAVIPVASEVDVLGPTPEDQYGFAEVSQDPADQSIRRGMMRIKDQRRDKVYSSLAYQMAMTYLEQEPTPIYPEPAPGNASLVKIGPAIVPRFRPNEGGYIDSDSRGYQYLLDYRGPRDLPIVSVDDIMSGRAKRAAIHDKIIVIGITALSNKDIARTPVNDKMWGVVFQGISAEHLLRYALRGAHPIVSWTDSSKAGWTLLWTLLGGAVGLRVRSPFPWALTWIGGVGAIIAAAHFAINRGMWIPLLPPAILWTICAALVTSYMYNREKQDRTVLMKLFSSQVSGAVAQEIWGNRDELLNEGRLIAREMQVTVLYADFKGAASLSQSMPPGDLMNWLNEYVGAMSKTVEKHGGIVNKSIGYALMAVFGAPVARTPENNARSAVACALEMRTQFGEMKLGWKMRGVPDLNMRIGIHTGTLVGGALGGAERAEYTVIGDTVDIAQQVESFENNIMDADIAADGCRIIVGQPTRDLLNGQFRLHPLGEIQISGRKELLAIHGVIQ